MGRSKRAKRYLCSICERPRIPANEAHPEFLVCGRCDLVQIADRPPLVEEPKPVQDEQ